MFATRLQPDGPAPTRLEGERLPAHKECPVLLATLGVPFEPDATTYAIECALESGQPLVIAGFTRMLVPGPRSMLYGQRMNPELDAVLRAPGEQARSFGLRVQVLKVQSPRPLQAILEVTEERDACLLVFGPDRSKVRRRYYRAAARLICARAPCLVWLAADCVSDE